MATKTSELDGMDIAALVQALGEAKDNHFKLRFKNATGQLENNAEFRKARRHIARINTLIRQQEIAAAEAGKK